MSSQPGTTDVTEAPSLPRMELLPGMELPPGISESDAFGALMAEYDRAIQSLTRTHEELHARVAELTAEVELKNRLLARQERLVALGEMAAGVAHEIRNPLAGISLYVEMLTNDINGQSGPSALCGKIKTAVSRLNHIVEAILSFTRPMEPNSARIDAGVFLNDVMGIAQADLSVREVEVDLTLDTQSLWGDAELLHQLMLNLLRNAIQASPVAGKVEVHARHQPADLDHPATDLLSIRDHGAGIADESFTRLFTPFFTTKQEGTGLGLALCQKIAHAHGGTLRAENHPDGGAVFTLSLPVEV